jgi:hypothetical protein
MDSSMREKISANTASALAKSMVTNRSSGMVMAIPISTGKK